jgi:hypothetical protein
MKPYDLEDIELMELSLVDVPANQHASVVLWKRFGYTDRVKPNSEGEINKGDGSVTVEELTKTLEGLQTQVTDLTKRAEVSEKRAETAEAAVEALTKSAAEAGLDVADGKIVKRADPEYVEIDGEKVEKSLVPAPVLKALEKAAADIAKMQAKAEEVELAKRGETELPNLAGTSLAKGRLLKALEGDAEMLATLKAADEAMKGKYEEKGDGKMDDDMAEPAKKLDRMAREYATEKNVPFEAAYGEITKSGEGYDLLRKMRTATN